MNKKAGFEMSITTIVTLVIAVIMLIMGLFLVRTIMCKGISLAQNTLAGAEKEIQNLFSSSTDDLACLGAEATLPAIAPGTYGIVGCGLNPKDRPHTYDVKFNITSSDIYGFPTVKEFADNGWIIADELNLNDMDAGPGSPNYASFAIKVPEDASTGRINMQVKVTRDDGKNYTRIIRYEVKSLGWLKTTMC